ncbi:MAG: hypothetical protein HKN87_07735 [Saprospiraceae bacterium]|nr:hypothetical protein [Saprospiraceae bacterium]
MLSWFGKKKRQRGSALRETAARLNLSYSPADKLHVLKLLSDFKLFGVGTRRTVKNLLWKDDHELDVKIRIFDYHYTVSTGKSSSTFKQTVFFVQSKSLGLPKFYMRPEHFLHKIGRWLGIEDIDFTSHEVFSDNYHLKGKEEGIIRDTFTEDVLHYFTFEKDWHLEGLNYYLIVYKDKERMQPDQIADFYEKGKMMFNLLSQGGYSV